MKYPTREDVLDFVIRLLITAVIVWLLGSVLTTIVARGFVDIIVILVIARVGWAFISRSL